MATVHKSLSARATEQQIEIAVTLPGYHTKGTPHGEIILNAEVTGGDLKINLFVYGEGTNCPGLYRGTFSATDLGIAPNRRTKEQVQKDHERKV